MKNQKLFRLFAAFFALTLLLSGCGNGQAQGDAAEYPVAEGPAVNQPLPKEGGNVFEIVANWLKKKLSAGNTKKKEENTAPAKNEMKGVWISYLEFDQILQGKSEAEYRTHVTAMMADIKNQGLNAVIVQVRSHGDSYYPSELYPWSSHASGTAGTPCAYDPFAVLMEIAKAHELSVHAWINPYRLMTDENMALISDQYAIKQWYQNKDYMAKGDDGLWYLNAGNQDVQKLIIDGVKEITEKYAVDGIQIDDYFYDRVKPSAFGQDNEKGRKNVTSIVKGIYSAVKEKDKKLVFGVSPGGNFYSIPASDESQLTDLMLWCKEEGYIDYVAPQIYWEFDNTEAPFSTVMGKWENLLKDSPVKLYIGLAAYKFAGTDILTEEIKAAEQSSVAAGYMLFRYENIKKQ